MAMTRGQFLIGRELGGCVLERLLGYGGSSAVFLAQQRYPECKVAVKVFLPRASIDAQMQRDFYNRFLLEAEATSQLHHPHILPIYSYGEQDGLPYIVMPYMQGGTLSEYITQHGPLSLGEAQWYLEQIASALDYAHEHGCIHCDVKPANILLNGEGQVMLSDFGIARVTQAGEATEQITTKPKEALMGTPDYISPEQALGQLLDGRSDVYSLGITLFYVLAKQLPFRADSTIALALLHVYEPPPSLALIRADISPAIDHVIHKALAKDPSRRFQTASAFSSAFAQAQNIVASPGPSEQDALLSNHAVVPALASNELQPLLVAAEPVVSVQPLSRRSFNLPRFFIIAAMVLMIIGAAAFATRITPSNFLKGAATTHLQTSISTSKDEANTDSLANHTSWPTSSTFFFDSHDSQLYHIANRSPQGAALALYADHTFNNFRLTVTMLETRRLNDAADYYGIIFHSTFDQSHCYLFEVSSSDGGQYVFSRYDDDGHNAQPWQTLADGPASSLLTGLGESNTISIQAHGTTFSFFVNNKSVGPSVTDQSKSALLSGEVGLYVEEQGAEVTFSHLYIQPSSK